MTQNEYTNKHNDITKDMLRTIIIAFSIVLISALFSGCSMKPQIVQDVQNETKTLECEFTDGWRVVPADKVVDLDDMTNRWIFSNGSASNCEVY